LFQDFLQQVERDKATLKEKLDTSQSKERKLIQQVS